MVDLRTRREQQTRLEIYQAAMALFGANGFDQTTVGDIARAANVSRRTIYRYFKTKDEIPFELPEKWLQHFRTLVAQREPETSCYDFCRTSVIDVARFIQSDAAAVTTAFQVLLSMPTLLARQHAILNRHWLESYVTTISNDLAAVDQPEMGNQPNRHLLTAGVIAGAIMGGTDQAVFIWLSVPESDLVQITRSLFDSIEPLWPELAKRPVPAAGPNR